MALQAGRCLFMIVIYMHNFTKNKTCNALKCMKLTFLFRGACIISSFRFANADRSSSKDALKMYNINTSVKSVINSSPKLLFAILQHWTASVLRTQQNNFNSSIIGLH